MSTGRDPGTKTSAEFCDRGRCRIVSSSESDGWHGKPAVSEARRQLRLCHREAAGSRRAIVAVRSLVRAIANARRAVTTSNSLNTAGSLLEMVSLETELCVWRELRLPLQRAPASEVSEAMERTRKSRIHVDSRSSIPEGSKLQNRRTQGKLRKS